MLLSAEIIFLRAITPAYPANHADIIFDITDGNLRDSFDIIKRYMDGMTVGEWPETAGPPGLPLVLPASGLAEACWEPARLPSESPGPSGLSWNPCHTHTPANHSVRSIRVVEPPALGETPVGSVSRPTKGGLTRSLHLMDFKHGFQTRSHR